jgi:glycolate oxidase FAD binding subunit
MAQEIFKEMIDSFSKQIQEAAQDKKKLNISGGQTKAWYGDKPNGESLSTTAYQGIIDYQPEELVITVRAGTLLCEVEEALAQKNQMFAFDPPHFGKSATIGGMIASGLAGPGRAQAGNLRDFVLGADIMDGNGRVLSFGGKVMKNVAGYDVSRLLPGSMGTLALLLNVSIKVLPKPAATRSLRFLLSEASAIAQMNLWASQPLPISASSWMGEVGDGTLTIRLAGATAAVEAATKKMSSEISGQILDDKEAAEFWNSLKEQSHSFFNLEPHQNLWRFAVNPMSTPMSLAGECCIEWLGGQRWYKGHLSSEQAKQIAAKHGGHATLFRGEKPSSESVFTKLSDNPLTAPLEVVQNRLRYAFDPQGVFQTGRMP